MRLANFSVIALLFAFAQSTRAQSVTYVSPGIKLGYTYSGGFVIGAELSIATWSEDRFGATGAIISFDHIGKDEWRIHAGFQACGLIGASVGPTFQKHRDSTGAFGWTASLFAGAYAMPYYSFTGIIKGGYSDSGFLFKLPIPISGTPIRPKDFFSWDIM
jgi:hypothetical protein